MDTEELKPKPKAIEDLLKYLDERYLKIVFSTLMWHSEESGSTRPFCEVINELWNQLIQHPIVWVGMETPYGDTAEDSKATKVMEIIPSTIGLVSTSCHGGYKIVCDWNVEIPEEYRDSDGWYEEDCDFVIPFHFLKKQVMDTVSECGVAAEETPFNEEFWNMIEEGFKLLTKDEDESSSGPMRVM